MSVVVRAKQPLLNPVNQDILSHLDGCEKDAKTLASEIFLSKSATLKRLHRLVDEGLAVKRIEFTGPGIKDAFVFSLPGYTREPLSRKALRIAVASFPEFNKNWTKELQSAWLDSYLWLARQVESQSEHPND